MYYKRSEIQDIVLQTEVMLLVVWLRAVLLEQHLGLRDQVRVHCGSVGLGYLSYCFDHTAQVTYGR